MCYLFVFGFVVSRLKCTLAVCVCGIDQGKSGNERVPHWNGIHLDEHNIKCNSHARVACHFNWDKKIPSTNAKDAILCDAAKHNDTMAYGWVEHAWIGWNTLLHTRFDEEAKCIPLKNEFRDLVERNWIRSSSASSSSSFSYFSSYFPLLLFLRMKKSATFRCTNRAKFYMFKAAKMVLTK